MYYCLHFVGQCFDVGCFFLFKPGRRFGSVVVIAIFPWNHSTSPSGGNQVDGLPPALSYSQQAVELQKYGSGLDGCFRCVSLIFSGSNQPKSISFCQNQDLLSLNNPILVSCLHKFVRYDILVGQGR